MIENPLIYVIGMHRSGTSAIAGAMTLFGLTPVENDDLLPPDIHNPKGYFESNALMQINDKILAIMHGTWSKPPTLTHGWQHATGLEELYSSLNHLIHSLTIDHAASVWKDPRLCLTLPVWQNALPDRHQVAVLVYRHPVEVAYSLRTRDKFHPAYGLALWERYVREALANLKGMSILIVRYEEALANPVLWCNTLTRFLAAANIPTTNPIPYEATTQFFEDGLRRERIESCAEAADTAMLPTQVELLELLDSSLGFHPSWAPPAVKPESPWVTAMLEKT
ncbi:MAG: sulfotransferase family protein [Acidimicrobiales bacterium]